MAHWFNGEFSVLMINDQAWADWAATKEMAYANRTNMSLLERNMENLLIDGFDFGATMIDPNMPRSFLIKLISKECATTIFRAVML